MEVIVLGALVFGIAYAFTHRGSNRTATDDWQPAQPISVPARGSDTRHVGSRAQHAAGVQLARVEGRQLMRNEVFIVGIFMSIAILVIFGLVWASDNLGANNSWRYWLALLPVFTLPFAGMTLVAMNLAALRARRRRRGAFRFATGDLHHSCHRASRFRVDGVGRPDRVRRRNVCQREAPDEPLRGDRRGEHWRHHGQLRARGVRRVARCQRWHVGSPIPWSRSSQWWYWRSEGPPSAASAATTGA